MTTRKKWMRLKPGESIVLDKASYPNAIKIKHYWRRKAKRPREFMIERISDDAWMLRRAA
jgi:hypothetical protein